MLKLSALVTLVVGLTLTAPAYGHGNGHATGTPPQLSVGPTEGAVGDVDTVYVRPVSVVSTMGEPTFSPPGDEPPPPMMEEPGGGGTMCFDAEMRHGYQDPFGLEAYWVYQRVMWCGDGNVITSIQGVQHWTIVNGTCFTQGGPSTLKMGGGRGSTSVDYRTTAEFGCSGYGPNWYTTVWHTNRYYPWGQVAVAGHH